MRLNRKIRIGAAIVAATLLLLGLITIYNRSRPQPTGSESTLNANADTEDGVPVAPVAATRVAYARENIPQRSIVTADMFEMRDAAPGADMQAFVTDPQTQGIGFVTARPITAGTQIRRGDFVGHISEVGIAGALLPGRRAMVVQIPNKSTLHDLVRIGDRVDVVASFDQQEARTIVQDVRILAVDVFGKDYPQVKVAMRGSYKASPRAVESANPPSPAGGAAAGNNTVSPDAPSGQNPQAAPGAAPQGPEPTPTQGPPPAAPEPAFTLEVTPEQATAIALTQSAGQNIDFLLRPRGEPGAATATGAAGALAGGETGETTIRAVSTTREGLAPYSARLKRAGGNTQSSANTRNVSASSRETGSISRPSRSYGSNFNGPSYPVPEVPSTNSVPPADTGSLPQQPSAPATYDIPVYGDGKLMRTDTVKRPQD